MYQLPRSKRPRTLRREIVDRLCEAIETADKIARNAGEEPNPSSGLSPKIRWYQVMGYLAQTVDGLLRNVDLTQAERDLAYVKEVAQRIEARASKSPSNLPEG